MRTRFKVQIIRKGVTPAWLVQQQEKKKSGWEILTDKKGKVIHHQLVPPSLENDRFFNESSRSSWVLEIIESCYVAGVGAEVGDMVHCYTPTANSLRCAGRVKVISETRNAF